MYLKSLSFFCKLKLVPIFFVFVLFLNDFCLADDAVDIADSDKKSIGEIIYTQGLDASGKPLQGKTEGDIEFNDAHFNCSQCHRRSGYGSSEGGSYVLPITGASLFNPRTFDRTDIFQKLFKETQSNVFRARMRSSYQRPAYTDETLAQAIREGIDPSGRRLSPLMPRFELSDREMAELIAYLKDLSAHNDPGVDDRSIHFATVVGKNVNSENKNAMLSTIAKYVEWLNLETKGNQEHPNFSPNYRSDFAKAFRIWDHDVWELSDNPAEWSKELAVYYEKKPVFALIGGMVDGNWQPIHEFCEKNRLPCLFPITQLPPVGQASHYSVYFNEGLSLEAKAIAHFLQKEKTTPIIQIYANDDEGLIPSKAFTQAHIAAGGGTVENFPVDNIENFKAEWKKYRDNHPKIGSIVVWTGRFKQELLKEASVNIQDIERIFLPSELLPKKLEDIDKNIAPKLYFSYPYELPSAYHPHAFRVRAWMDTRKLEISKATLQFNIYYALNLLQFGLEPIAEHFSRDYLLEYIEHDAENELNPGTFPRLSLGPEQRFASKGAYLVKLDVSGKQLIMPVSDWIVP